MGKQIRLLTKISLYGLFGLNEFRFTKDKKKKSRFVLMGILWVFVILMLAFYVGMASYGMIAMGAAGLVPALLAMSVSVIVLVFTMLKAGAVLFDYRAYEKEIALPVTVRAVIVSRFFTMYITNMLMGMIVMIPGIAVYGILEKPPVFFYLYGAAGIVFLPLLPLTAASVFGALITGVSSRWKRRNLVSIVLTLLFAGAVLAGSMQLSNLKEDQIAEMAQHAAVILEAAVQKTYPPALWISEAMVHGKIGSLLLFIGVSCGSFLVFLEIVQKYYGKICSILAAHETSGNYKMKGLRGKSIRGSLIVRELRHYFSSSVYVTNTIFGELMMTALAAAVLIAGIDQVERMIGLSGILQRALPVILGMMPAMMPMSASSISIEGKQWWMLQTLPVTEKDIIRSKVWADILVVLPFYLISEVLLILALRPGPADLASLLLVPAVYIVFGAEAGTAINLRLPVFDWENEAKIVKQSAAAFAVTLLGLMAGLVPCIVLIALPAVSAYKIYGLTICVLLAVMWILQRKKYSVFASS